MIGYREFDLYLAFVRRSDVHTTLEAALAGAPQGRKRNLTCDVLLAAMVATATRDKNLTLVAVHKTLTAELSNDYQRRLGIRGPRGPLTVRQVRYLWNAITDLYEHTPGRRPDLDIGERVERSARLQLLIDQLLASATQHVGAAGRYAVDESAIDSAARGKRRPKLAEETTTQRKKADDPADQVGRSADVDAEWGYRTKTYHNRTKQVFGYQLVGFTGVPPVGEPDRPLLLERISVVAANSHGIEETISGLARLREEGVEVAEVLADRGFSYKTTDRWADKLREMGIEQVLDLHENDRGARAHPAGYVMVDGWAHCPSVPDELVNITRPARFTVGVPKKNATADERLDAVRRQTEVDEFNRLIAERRVYRFERAGRTKEGNERFTCPSRAGKLKCGGCPLSADYADDVLEVVPPRDENGNLRKACAQRTITLKPTVEAKRRQRDYWGSPEWQASYNRRSDVERSFGLLKVSDGGGIQRGWTRQHGLVKTTLLLAIAVAASNLRILIAWARRNGDTRDPLTTMDVASRGFVELDDDGNPLSDTGPPRDADD